MTSLHFQLATNYNWYNLISLTQYDISLAYDATHEDQLLDIFRILKANRQQIREIWGE